MPIEVTRRRSGADVRRILEALPDWFGDPEAIDNYVTASQSDDYNSLLASDGPYVLGVALVRRYFPETAELHLLAVAPDA